MRDQKGWSKVKKQVRVRDQNECQISGLNTNLEVHHIIPYEICQHNEEWNLITLHKERHDLVDGLRYKIFSYQNRTGMEKFTHELDTIFENVPEIRILSERMKRWSKVKKNKASYPDIAGLMNYFVWISDHGFSIEFRLEKKANGDRILHWYIDHPNMYEDSNECKRQSEPVTV